MIVRSTLVTVAAFTAGAAALASGVHAMPAPGDLASAVRVPQVVGPQAAQDPEIVRILNQRPIRSAAVSTQSSSEAYWKSYQQMYQAAAVPVTPRTTQSTSTSRSQAYWRSYQHMYQAAAVPVTKRTAQSVSSSRSDAAAERAAVLAHWKAYQAATEKQYRSQQEELGKQREAASYKGLSSYGAKTSGGGCVGPYTTTPVACR